MRLTPSCERLKEGIPLDVMRDGKRYRHQMWYEDNFDVADAGIRLRRKQGLPYIKHEGHPYINLQDWFDFHSGQIGIVRERGKGKT